MIHNLTGFLLPSCGNRAFLKHPIPVFSSDVDSFVINKKCKPQQEICS
jgi:hypothetical protein